ncbi:MAG: efflux RND transporter periplasmic adaptor subunit [Butyrivibrio sp.]|nr:efflux RND transporter periplasmic adaptor subunit [Acetatifactor muris]MCM1559413.1 efflux RND transporter periplasmic adaptor subunit [Butyrivibrio sp.]
MGKIRMSAGIRLFCVCSIAGLSLCGCGEEAPEEPLVIVEDSDDTLSNDFIYAGIGDVILTGKMRCTYRQQKDQEISFSLSGRLVDKVYVAEGDIVKKGDLLAELSPGTLEEQIEDLEYRIARNELLLEYTEINEALDISQVWVNYAYNGYYDEAGRDQAIADIQKNYRYQREDDSDALELDRRKLEELKQELAHCRVYADMEGMVYKLQDRLENSTSKEGEVIMTIVDNSQCLFETEMPEYNDCFREGETVEMSVITGAAAGQYELLPYAPEEWGEVQQFSVYAGPMTTGIEVGTTGTIEFVLEKREQVLCVPKTAVNSGDGRYYVYVTDEDGMRQIRWVEIGLAGDDMIEIRSGLEEGEKVIRR